MERPEVPERGALAVPLERIGGSSRRRAWLAVVVWSLGLVAATWPGLGGHDNGPVVAAAPGVAAPSLAASASATTHDRTEARNVAPRMSPPIVHHRSLGDDGLVGGIVFGDNVRASDGPS